jgi:hypothetical protein
MGKNATLIKKATLTTLTLVRDNVGAGGARALKAVLDTRTGRWRGSILATASPKTSRTSWSTVFTSTGSRSTWARRSNPQCQRSLRRLWLSLPPAVAPHVAVLAFGNELVDRVMAYSNRIRKAQQSRTWSRRRLMLRAPLTARSLNQASLTPSPRNSLNFNQIRAAGAVALSEALKSNVALTMLM